MGKVARPTECHPDRKHYSGGKCRACYMVDHRAKHPDYREQMRQYARVYKEQNPEKYAGYQAKRKADPSLRERDRISSTNTAYKVKYGMSVDDIKGMLAAQGGKCKVCENDLPFNKSNVDHCHNTGYVRGILCTGCNTGIGQLGDNAEGLMRALAYLQSSPSSFRASKYEN